MPSNRDPGSGTGNTGPAWRSRLLMVDSWVGRNTALCLLAMLVLLLVVLFGNRQTMTGDEPRYLLYAMSFIRHGTLVMPLAEWNGVSMRAAHYAAGSLPAGGGNQVVMNGVYLPVMLSPVAGLFSLAGLRGATLLSGLAGLWFLHRLLRRVSGPLASLAVLLVVAFSLPLLPYLHLFYMETFLFALVCCAWERLQTSNRGLAGDLLTAVLLVLVPVVHLRGSVVAALLFLWLLSGIVRRRLWRRAALVLLIAAGVGSAFVAANLVIYGSVTGPVNTARPPSPADWFPVLSMQLFNVHHGLFAYAPIWVAGYAGLLCAVLRANRGSGRILMPRPADPALPVLRQALVLGLVAALTGVGVNPGECWPARFWVLSMPMLAVGLAYWMQRARGVLPIACLVGLLVVTAANTMLFVKAPNDFLENRQTSSTYTHLFERFGHVDANLVLPVETTGAPDIAAARNLALAAGVVILSLAIALRLRMAALPALLVLLGVLDLGRAQRLSPAGYAVAAGPDRLSVRLDRSVRHPVVEIGRPWQTWFVPPSPERFVVHTDGSGGQVDVVVPANQVIAAGCQGPVGMVGITSQGTDLRDQSGFRLRVLGSRSWLRRLVAFDPC